MKKPGDTQKAADETASATALDADDPILKQLRSVYDDITAEPLPDQLLDLLQQLDVAERNR